jgi:hypothetical protein
VALRLTITSREQRPASRSIDPVVRGATGQLEPPETRESERTVQHPRRYRPDAEERRQGRVRLVMDRWISVTRRGYGAADRTVVREAATELPEVY